jgi:DNA-binding SARP family transcriptional activator/tetratricopeptide (TPR) repeat protein
MVRSTNGDRRRRDLDFRVLGPLEVRRRDTMIEIGTPKQRAILALLLLEANRPVTMRRMVNELWPVGPPPSAVANVTTYLSRLRRQLSPAGCDLVRQAAAYVLHTDAESIDSNRFAGHGARGDDAWRAGHTAAAVRHWQYALDLWRGQLFDGVPAGRHLDAARADWSERRLTVFERYALARLHAGDAADVVAELRRHTTTEPMRETGWLLLMAALRLSGSSAAALETYQHCRTALAEQLGVDPGAQLQKLHQAILRDDNDLVRDVLGLADMTSLSSAPARSASHGIPAVVAQLPATARRLLGRDAQLARLDDLVLDTPSLTMITGTAGIGKTALAVTWAQRSTYAFPDGQLFVDLRGFAPGPPLSAQQALTGFLLALGVPAETVPVDLDQQAALYRSLISDRTMLVVLDNAVDTAQIRPLLPGAASCAVLITSRRLLGGLAALYDVQSLSLTPLACDDAVELLAGTQPSAWSGQQLTLVKELAGLCGYLPLALRIASANVRMAGAQALAEHVARFRSRGLDVLAVDHPDELAIRTTFDHSYVALSPGSRRLFRLIAVAPGADLTLPTAMALAGQPRQQTLQQLDELTTSHLLEASDTGRYQMHDLLRAYGIQQCASDEPPVQRDASLARLRDFYLHTVRAATDLACPMGLDPLTPPTATVQPLTFDATDQAMAWLEEERPSLLAAARQAASSADIDTARWSWTCARHLQRYFWARRHNADWLALGNLALTAAQRAGDQPAQAQMRHFLGVAHWALGSYQSAVEHTQAALGINERLGDLAAQAANLSNLCGLLRATGDMMLAAEYGERSLVLYRGLNDTIRHANADLNLATIRLDLGDFDRAAIQLTRLAETYQASGYTDGVASATMGLCTIAEHQGRHDAATAHARDVLRMDPDGGSRTNWIYAQTMVLALTADPTVATLAAMADLVDEARSLHDAEAEAEVLCRAGQLAMAVDRPTEAATHFDAALRIARAAGERHCTVEAQARLAAARFTIEPCADHLAEVHQAVELAAAHGLTIRRSIALTIEAEIALALNDRQRAITAARQALDIHHSCGAQQWRRRTEQVLAAAMTPVSAIHAPD